MNTAPATKAPISLFALAQRPLRSLRRQYLRRRIRWAQQDLAHMAHERACMPARMQALSDWIEARRVDVAMLERAP